MLPKKNPLPKLPTDFEVIDESQEELTLEEQIKIHNPPTPEPPKEYISDKEIVPMGGKKSKIKDKTLDKRKNLAVSARIVQWIFFLIILALLVLAVFNVFFPQNNYNRGQIEEIALNAVGTTGFPRERGEAFATDFITEYLIVDNTSPVRNQSLEYFYTGKLENGQNTRRDAGKNVKQYLLIHPKVFEITMLGESTANYKLSAYITDTDGTFSHENKMKGRWVSFSVNVYYDKKTNKMMITEDSPTIIPKYELDAVNQVPLARELGNGTINQDILPTLTPTIEGYIQAFAFASGTSHDSILQYIPSNPEPTLYQGFGGQMKLRGKPNEAIKKVVYNTNDSNEFKVMVDVTWEDARLQTKGDNEKRIFFTSKYVMTIQKTSNNKYLVTRFAPYLYLVKDENKR